MVRAKATSKKHKNGRKKSGPSAFRNTLLTIGAIVCCVLGFLGAAFWRQIVDLPDISILERYEPIEAVQIYDRNDKMVTTVEGDEDRQVVPLNQISNQMQQAMLAAEDHHFYEHHGINPVSIFRALMANILARRVVEGGSTITQQLVKNLFFEEPRRNIDRKVKEAIMAWELERRYPKEKILELYLNQVYFGNGAYGIERAASRYFDRSAASLNLAESAFLAGLVKAPSELSTEANRQDAIDRQHFILDRMVEYGYVTASQAKTAKDQKLVFKKGINPLSKFPYYVSYVLEILRSHFSPAEMRRQGLRVYTNLDPQAQEIAETVLNESIKKAPKGVTQGALVSINVRDGAVIAMVGGVGNYWKNQFNRATNPHTVGSAFKPFVYLTGFVKGQITPETIVADEPFTIKQGWGLPDWSPKDFDHKFMGKITVRKALTLSRNVPAVRIGQMVGIDNVIETARLAGVTTKLDNNLSLALGSSAVSPLDMAAAYSTFARAGISIRPQVVRRIENNRGQTIQVFESRVDKAFESQPVSVLVDIMQDVVKMGTGTQARLADRPVAGKTGTADEAKDIWFIGFTPDLVTAVWGGNDDNLPIPGTFVTGGTVMAKIWKSYNQAYYEKYPTPPGAFIIPTADSGLSGAEQDLLKEENMEPPTALPGMEEINRQPQEVKPMQPMTPQLDQAPPPAPESDTSSVRMLTPAPAPSRESKNEAPPPDATGEPVPTNEAPRSPEGRPAGQLPGNGPRVIMHLPTQPESKISANEAAANRNNQPAAIMMKLR